MFYYGMTFKATEKLLGEGWDRYDGTDELEQMFYCKSRKSIGSIAEMQAHLKSMFLPSDEYNTNLVNCLDNETIEALKGFFEIDASEFESCCGCSTEND